MDTATIVVAGRLARSSAAPLAREEVAAVALETVAPMTVVGRTVEAATEAAVQVAGQRTAPVVVRPMAAAVTVPVQLRHPPATRGSTKPRAEQQMRVVCACEE